MEFYQDCLAVSVIYENELIISWNIRLNQIKTCVHCAMHKSEENDLEGNKIEENEVNTQMHSEWR